eukprot:264488-Hanusia_phi.AAC.1
MSLPLAMSIAVSIRVGNLLGEGKGEQARMATRVRERSERNGRGRGQGRARTRERKEERVPAETELIFPSPGHSCHHRLLHGELGNHLPHSQGLHRISLQQGRGGNVFYSSAVHMTISQDRSFARLHP